MMEEYTVKTCKILTNLIMDYWTKCVSKNLEADFKVNDLIENFAETCQSYETPASPYCHSNL